MSQNRTDLLLKRFYEGKTSKEEEIELFAHVDDEATLAQRDFYEMSKTGELSDAFDDELRTALGRKQGRQIRLFWTQLSRAAVILLLGVLGGIFYRDHQTEDLSNLREELALVLSEQQSAHLRLKGLELAMDLPQLQGEIFETISQMLGNDENVNVRLSAFNVLRTSTDERTQSLLMLSVMEQESFLVQASILKYLLSLSDPTVKGELLELLENATMKEERKKQIENLITL